MIPAGFEYRAPGSIAETISLLQEHGSDAKIISGGQSLIPMMRFRMISPQMLIDIGRIPGLDLLVEETGYLRIGASVRTGTLEHSSLIAQRYPLLAAGTTCSSCLRSRRMRPRRTGRYRTSSPVGS